MKVTNGNVFPEHGPELLLRPVGGVICLRFISFGVNLTSSTGVKKASDSLYSKSHNFRV